MEYLVLSEVSKKQEYIFRTNKLSENIGASLIIKYVTEELPEKLIDKYLGEVIMEGGGKSLYKFEDESNAKAFIKELSTKILKEYPGVEIFMVIQEIDMAYGMVIDSIEEAYEKLAVKKNERRYSGREVSFGIQDICGSTGLPATTTSNDINKKTGKNKLISSEIDSKLKFKEDKEKNYKKLIPDGYIYSKEFDDLTNRKNGDKDYISVVYIDGNRMGDKFEILKRNYKDKTNGNIEKENYEYLMALRSLSEKIKESYESAFKEMCKITAENKELISDDTQINENIFPIRPLIIAGDDVSFVTNGKIGIECARTFLEDINSKEIEAAGVKIKLNACAGIAIVKSHYPFSKAYELAEDLCKNCKKTLAKDYGKKDYSLIDWHIAQGEISGSLAKMRAAYYQNGKLTMKPLYINNDNEWKTYKNYLNIFDNINNKEAPRGKIKSLREVFRKGLKDSEVYIRINGLEKYIGNLESVNCRYGFADDGTCLYFDAIECMDLFIKFREV